MAEELRTVLGFEAAGAIATLSKLTAGLDSYSAALAKSAAANKAFNASGKGFSTTAINAVGATGKLSSSMNQGIVSSKKYTNSLTGLGTSTTKLADTTKKASSDMLLSWKSVVRIFAIQVIHQMISKVSGSLQQSAEDAREYVKALSEIQTIADKGFGGLENLAAKVEEFAAATGQPLTAVTEGIYQTLSNQVADAAHSFEFLQAASDFSIAAVTDLGSSVELLSSIINSYNLNTSDAADISGKLFRAIELGRFRGEEIANTIGRITVLSGQLGVELEETLASITVLTRSGMKYDEAFTLVSNIQLKLIKPTQNLKNLFKEMGIATAEAGIQAYGFQGFLAEIEKGAGNTASELAKLYGRIRAIRAALGLGSKYMETYTSDLKELKEASAETIKKAKDIVFETNAKQVELELNKLNIALVNFGRGATDVTKVIFDSFGGATGAITTFTTALALGGTTWLLLHSNILKGTESIISSLRSVGLKTSILNANWMKLVKSPILWAAAVAIAVTTISYYLNKYIKKAKEVNDALVAESTGRERVALANYRIELEVQKEANKKILSEVQKMLFAKQKLYNDASQKIKFIEGVMFGILEDQLDDHVSAAQSLLDGLKDTVADLPSKLKDIAKETYDIKVNILDWEFERSLKGLSEVEEANKRINRSQQLRNDTIIQTAKGEYDLAKASNERALSEANSALAIAEQIGDKRLIKKAEDEVRAVMYGQLPIQDKMRKNAIDQVDAINSQIKGMERLVKTLEQQENQYKKLIKQLEKTTDPVDREKILAKLKLVAKDIEATIGRPQMNVDFANAPELTKELIALSQNFHDSLTNQRMSFEKAVTASVGRINALRAKTPDVSEQQAVGVEIGKQLDISTKATAAQSEATGKLKTEIVEATGKYNIFAKTLEKTAKIAAATRLNTWDTKSSIRENVDAIKARYKIELDAAIKLAATGKAGTTEYNTRVKNIQALNTLLRESSEKVEKDANEKQSMFGHMAESMVGFFMETDTGINKAVNSGQDLVETLLKLSELQATATAEGKKAEVGKAISERLKGAADPVKETLNYFDEAVRKLKDVDQGAENTGTTIDTEISSGAQTAADGVAKASSSMIASLKAVAAQARITAAANAAAATKMAARGGMIYRAGGGFTSRGTDTIPAMLSPGEFVVNAAASRRFFSQLVTMNSGKQPIYRETGGSVGDININVTESKSPQSTAREIAAQIRREINRKTIRKF